MLIDDYHLDPKSVLPRSGRNCLHLLCQHHPESLDTFRMLIDEYHIDPRILTKNGESPRDILRRLYPEYQATIDFLSSYH